MFGRATIMLGIGPHFQFMMLNNVLSLLAVDILVIFRMHNLGIAG